jgi:RNA polymerase subunit RPABC4/transcription elongation factor Spt4
MFEKSLLYFASTAIGLFALVMPAAAGSFSLDRKLTAPDGVSGDNFGFSAALDGNIALIGSYADDDNGNRSGSAYLFDTTSGDLLHKLTAPDGANEDNFGWSVAIDGNLALIGAYVDDSFTGSAYLFDTTSGDFLHKLTAPDGISHDRFGWSVAIDGDFALIGASGDDDNGGSSGSAYLFDTTTGNFLYKLTAPDSASQDWFGYSVAIDGNSALIGSRQDDDNGSDSGSAYLFDLTSGDLLHKLTAPDGASQDWFGYSVAIDGNSALIGSRLDDNKGSAYLFDTASGELLHKLTAFDGAVGDDFGEAVAIDGNLALIGSQRDDNEGIENGSVYLFDTTSGELLQKLIASDTASLDRFGRAIALDGDSMLISAFLDDDNGENSGSAYLFEATSVPEPVSILGLLAIASLGMRSLRKEN